MKAQLRWFAVGLVFAGSLLTFSAVIFAGQETSLLRILTGAGAAIATAGGLLLIPRASALQHEQQLALQQLQIDREALQKQQEEFEEIRSQAGQLLASQSERIRDREQQLAQRLTKFHEFLEFPAENAHQNLSPEEIIRLSEQDREVHKILEAEAERVYEKIRANGYTKDGKPDFLLMRDEAGALIRRVALVYSPNSESPLLETSFEQLARALGRICLHVLVLLEQLPVNVQQYNLSSLYTYFRRAAVGYGAYQKAAPWLTYITRGIYVGRLATASNPITLGAWWLATEVGRRGAQKWVENVLDRQAIAILHDLITILGVEVASVFGKGFRHRDPAWVMGNEIVELLSHFPVSRDSLSEGLKAVTQLPLRNEYDRIYLYRCLATHKSPASQLPDPAVLTREERESIAARIEEFFQKHVHGVTTAQTEKWRSAFEQRFDLKLKLNSSGPATPRSEHIREALQSLQAFVSLSEVADDHLREKILRESQLMRLLPADQRSQFQLLLNAEPAVFQPPNLDPTSDVTEAFLTDLVRADVLLPDEDQHLEQLVLEIGAYFRRSAADIAAISNRQFLSALASRSAGELPHPDLDANAARAIIELIPASAEIDFAYPAPLIRFPDKTEPIPQSWIVGYHTPADTTLSTIVISGTRLKNIVWKHRGPLTAERVRGILIDDLLLLGGEWTDHVAVNGPAPTGIQLSGSLKSGRFRNCFAKILTHAQLKT